MDITLWYLAALAAALVPIHVTAWLLSRRARRLSARLDAHSRYIDALGHACAELDRLRRTSDPR